MTQPKCAVILAAGMGSRLTSVWPDLPKGFLLLDGLAIVERSIRQLLHCGITNIILVTGYGANHYQALAVRYPMIQVVYNAHYVTSGHMYSLYCAHPFVQSDFLLVEADLLYERRGLTTLLRHPAANALLTSGFTLSGDEVFVDTRAERVVKLSKQRAELVNITGELVGIAKISAAMFTAMVAYAEHYFQQDLNLPYEACINAVTPAVEVSRCHVEDLVWAEIDTPAHWARVQQHIFPRLQAEWHVAVDTGLPEDTFLWATGLLPPS